MKITAITAFLVLSSFLVYSQVIDWSLLNNNTGNPIEGKFNGFNMDDLSYGLICEQGPNITVTNECINCLDYNCSPFLTPENVSGSQFISMQTNQNIINATAALKPSILRFPGGTQTGWYHLYDYGNDIIYDASNPTVAKGFGMLIGETIFLPSSLDVCKESSLLMTDKNFIEGFVNYIKNVQNETGEPIEVTYVANLLTHFNFDPFTFGCLQTCGRTPALTPMDNFNCSQKFEYSYAGNEALFSNNLDIYRFELYYKETQDALEYFVTELNLTNDDVLYLELGNEYYANVESTSGYAHDKYQMSVNEYADLCEIYAERLKCYFAGQVDLKIAMLSKSGKSWQETTDPADINFPGLKNLMQQDATSNGVSLDESIDGIILHDYYTQLDCLDEDDISTRFECAKQYLNDHVSAGGNLENELNNFQLDFPNQKIWLTEWSLTIGDNRNYLNTALYASFVLEYGLSMIRHNSENSNHIEMATHHRIGADNKWSAIQTEQGNNTSNNIRSNYHPMQYLGMLNEYDNFSYIENLLSNGTTTFDTKEAQATALFQQNDNNNQNDRLLIYYTNKTNNPIPFTLPATVNGQTITSAKISFVNGDYLFTYGPANSTNGENYFSNSNGTSENSDLNTLGYGSINNQLNVVTDSTVSLTAQSALPKNATGVIVLNLETPLSTQFIKQEETTYKLFPNPAQNNLTIQLDTDNSDFLISAIITSILGETISSHRFQPKTASNAYQINTSSLKPGSYFIQLQSDLQITTLVFIKE